MICCPEVSTSTLCVSVEDSALGKEYRFHEGLFSEPAMSWTPGPFISVPKIPAGSPLETSSPTAPAISVGSLGSLVWLDDQHNLLHDRFDLSSANLLSTAPIGPAILSSRGHCQAFSEIANELQALTSAAAGVKSAIYGRLLERFSHGPADFPGQDALRAFSLRVPSIRSVDLTRDTLAMAIVRVVHALKDRELQADRVRFEASVKFAESVSLVQSGHELEETLVSVYAKIDDLLDAGKVADCNAIIRNVDAEKAHADILLALLMATFPVPRDEIPARQILYEQAYRRSLAAVGKQETCDILDRLK